MVERRHDSGNGDMMKIEEAGPKLWAQLHARPFLSDYNAQTEQRWLVGEFAEQIPCPTCRQHWRALCAEYPPDLSSPASTGVPPGTGDWSAAF